MRLHEFLERALRQPRFVGTGRLIALEPERLDAERSGDLMRAINKLSLRTLLLEDVHIRGMNAANDVIDHYDSRFTVKGLRQAAKIYADSSMAEGHDMGSKALARVFAGDTLENAEGSKIRELRDLKKASWLQGMFYWSRKLSWADDLAEAIDTGVQREVSLHWLFEKATCGICDEDIRSCDHWPGEVYDDVRAWYDMEDVTEIIETSFVLKGGQRGTSLWEPSAVDQAASMSFGRALRELKSDRQAWSEWKRTFDPSSNGEKSHARNGAARWLASGLNRGQ